MLAPKSSPARRDVALGPGSQKEKFLVEGDRRVKFVEAVIRQATAVSFPDMFRHTLNWAQEIVPGKNGLNLVGGEKDNSEVIVWLLAFDRFM